MAYPISIPADSLRTNTVHRFATLWKLSRTDGEELLFTDDSAPIIYDGEIYTPAGGFNASARLAEDALRSRGFDARGVLSSEEVTHRDLRSGRYRDCQIDEFIVDSMYPYEEQGLFKHTQYLVLETQFDGEIWEAEVVGQSRKLRPKIGRLLMRDCDEVLGGPRCGVNLAPFTVTGATVTWVSPNQPRKKFRASGLPNVEYFNYGKVSWTGAAEANFGLVGEVKRWFSAEREVRLQLAMPFDIEVGHEFSIEPGCLKTDGHCLGTSGDGDRPWPSNILNFQGQQFMPGTDDMIRTPKSK